MCLVQEQQKRIPGKGSLHVPKWVELRRKTGQRGFLITRYKRLKKKKKDSDRAITPAVEAVCVPEHFTPPGSLQTMQLHPLHTQLSLGQSCHRPKQTKKKNKNQKIVFCLCVTSVLSNSLQPCRLWPARLLCERVSPGKNTGVYWPILVTIPFWSTILPAALASSPPE